MKRSNRYRTRYSKRAGLKLAEERDIYFGYPEDDAIPARSRPVNFMTLSEPEKTTQTVAVLLVVASGVSLMALLSQLARGGVNWSEAATYLCIALLSLSFSLGTAPLFKDPLFGEYYSVKRRLVFSCLHMALTLVYLFYGSQKLFHVNLFLSGEPFTLLLMILLLMAVSVFCLGKEATKE